MLGGAWKGTVKVMWLVSDGSERSMARPQADLLWREGVGTRTLQVVSPTTTSLVFIMFSCFIYIEFTFQIYKITLIFIRLIKPHVTVQLKLFISIRKTKYFIFALSERLL